MAHDESDSARRAKIRDAFASASAANHGGDESRIRAALSHELVRHGVQDLSEWEMRFLVDGLRSSRRAAGWRLAGSLARNLVTSVVGAMRVLNLNSQPRWTLVPNGIPSVEQFQAPPSPVVVRVKPADLRHSHELIGRLFRELPSPDPDEPDVRPCDCWLSHREQNDRFVTVMVGDFSIARLGGPDAELAIATIRKYGGARHAIAVVMDVRGADPNDAHLEITLPGWR